MLAFINSSEKTSPTIIGAGCDFNGTIRTTHSVQIHGNVVGDIFATAVVIGRGGTVVGKVVADNFFLHGTMDGPVNTDIANIFNNAKMTGTLSYDILNITGNTGLECKLSKKKAK